MGTVFYPSGSGNVAPTGTYIVTPPRRSSRRGASTHSPDKFLISTSNPGGVVFTGAGGPLANPNWPCIAGPETVPTDSTSLPVDEGTAYLFDFTVPPSGVGGAPQFVVAEFEVDGTHTQQFVAFDLYKRGNEVVQDEVVTVVCPVRQSIGTGTSPPGDVTISVQTAGDNDEAAYIMSAGTSWRVGTFFDVANLVANYSNYRVVRVGLRYIAWRDPTALAAMSEGLELTANDSSGFGDLRLYATHAVTDYETTAKLVTRWFGEANLIDRFKDDRTTPSDNGTTWPGDLHPWTIAYLAHMAFGDETMSFRLYGHPGVDTSQLEIFLDYLDMVVEVVPERRIATSIRLIQSFGFDSPPTIRPDGRALTNELRYALDSSFFAALDPGDYTLVMRGALTATPSDPVNNISGTLEERYGEGEAIGPSVRIKAVTQSRDSLDEEIAMRIAPVSGGVIAAPPVALDDYLLAVTIRDPADKPTGEGNVSPASIVNGNWWSAYTAMAPPTGSQIHVSRNQDQTIQVDGLTTYDRVKLQAYPDPLASASLIVTVYASDLVTVLATSSVAAASVLAVTPVAGSWREFTLTLNTPITPPAGQVVIRLSSATSAVAPWWIAAALRPEPIDAPTPGGVVTDHAVVLECVLPAIAAPTQTVLQQAIPATSDAVCGIAAIDYVAVSWPSDPQYAEYAVDLSVNGGAYDHVAIVANTGGTLTYNHFWAPWNQPLKYRLVGIRASDRLSLTGAAPVSSIGPLAHRGAVIGISTDTVMAIYAPMTDGEVVLSWTDLNTGELIGLHDEDGQRIMFTPEDRGLALAVPVLVQHWASIACTLGIADGTPYTVGQLSLGPEAFDAIRALAQNEVVHVRFPSGMVRHMTLQLGALEVRTQFGLYRTQLAFADAPFDLVLGADL